MPLPDRAERAAARERQLADQKKRNADAFKAHPEFGEHDPEVAKAAKAQRLKTSEASAAASTSRPGSRRVVSFPSKKAEK